MADIAHATFEAALDGHASWYGCNVTRDNLDAHSGAWSLLVTTTAAFGSGAQLDNYPYVPGIVPGQEYNFSCWYRETTATMPAITWTIRWRSEDATQIATQVVSLPRATGWTMASTALTAPPNATRVNWTFTWSSSAVGPAWRLDDVLVKDAASTEPTPTGPWFFNGALWLEGPSIRYHNGTNWVTSP